MSIPIFLSRIARASLSVPKSCLSHIARASKLRHLALLSAIAAMSLRHRFHDWPKLWGPTTMLRTSSNFSPTYHFGTGNTRFLTSWQTLADYCRGLPRDFEHAVPGTSTLQNVSHRINMKEYRWAQEADCFIAITFTSACVHYNAYSIAFDYWPDWPSLLPFSARPSALRASKTEQYCTLIVP